MFEKTRNMKAALGLFLLSSIFIGDKNHKTIPQPIPQNPIAKTQMITSKHSRAHVIHHKHLREHIPSISADSSIHTPLLKDTYKYFDRPAMIVVNATKNEILCGINENQSVNPGSLAKMLTLYLTLLEIKAGNLGLDEKLPVTEVDPRADLAMLKVNPSDNFTTELAIKGIVTRSAADACDILARRIAGDVPSFVEQMNEVADSLGMTNTVFTSPSGDPHTYGGKLQLATTTATDQAIALEALNKEAKSMPQDVQDAVYAKYLDFHGIRIPNHALIPGATFGKTAWANQSGRSTFLIFPKDGDDYIVGVFGGKSNKARNAMAEKLFHKFSSDKKEKTELAASDDHRRHLFHRKSEVRPAIEPEQTVSVKMYQETTKSFHPAIPMEKDGFKAMAATSSAPKMKSQ